MAKPSTDDPLALEYAKRHEHSGLVYPYWPAYDAFRAGYRAAIEKAAAAILADSHGSDSEFWASPSHQAVCTPCRYVLKHSRAVRQLSLETSALTKE